MPATTTLADGSYTFERVEPGPHFFFMISEMGRSVHEIGAVELPAWPEFEHDVRLAPGRITGTVVDGRTGEGVSGCFLLLEVDAGGGERFSALGSSGPGGAFAFGDLVARTYAITAYPAQPGLGFARSESIVIVEGAPELAPVEIALFEGGEVEVVVHDASGKPLASAVVEFVDDEGRSHGFSGAPQTDQRGRFRARGVRPGRYQVRAAFDGYEPGVRELEFDPAAGAAEVEFVLEARPADVARPPQGDETLPR